MTPAAGVGRDDRPRPWGPGRTVWLASYPKAGSTWVRAVLAALQTGDPFALHELDPIAACRARFEDALGIPSSHLSRTELDALRPLADEVFDAAAPGPHLHKIHDAFRPAPGGPPIVSPRATRCAVYVLRDPRDVVVSLARHNDRDVAWAVRTLCDPAVELNGAADDAARQMPQRLGDWSTHVRSWVDQTPFPVHVLRYEDCVADPLACLGAAFDFAGLAWSRPQLATAVEAASFSRLQAREEAEGFAERYAEHSPFFRRGAVGGWQDELDGESLDLIEACHGPEMARWGYLDELAGSSPG